MLFLEALGKCKEHIIEAIHIEWDQDSGKVKILFNII